LCAIRSLEQRIAARKKNYDEVILREACFFLLSLSTNKQCNDAEKSIEDRAEPVTE
jgi:hypothetical protein